MGNSIIYKWQHVGCQGAEGWPLWRLTRALWCQRQASPAKTSRAQGKGKPLSWEDATLGTLCKKGSSCWPIPTGQCTTWNNVLFFLFALPMLNVYHQKIWGAEVTMLSWNLQCCWNVNLCLRMSPNIILLLEFDLVNEIYACSHTLIFVLISGFGILCVCL